MQRSWRGRNSARSAALLRRPLVRLRLMEPRFLLPGSQRASLLRNNRPRRRPMYPRKSPIQQGRRRVVSGAVPYPAKCCTSRGEPGSRYAPAGWPAWHRPPRNPTGSRFSNRRAAAEQASGGVSGSESLSDTSPWLSGRACHPSQKENSTLALGRVRAWHCGSCPCNRGYDWKRPGAATGVIRIV